MRDKSTKKIKIFQKEIKKKLTTEKLTSYSGLVTVFCYIKKTSIDVFLSKLNSDKIANALKFSTQQILLSVLLANLCGLCRKINIEKFTEDPLVSHLLGLSKRIDEDTIKQRLQQLGESGAHTLHELMLSISRNFIKKTGLKRITIDCDSTVKTVYGHQEGASKGYNPHKKGATSYHPLLCFLAESKQIINSWFRAGDAYTSNGIVEFMKQTIAMLPSSVKKIFFRADSGFFNGALFDFLENFGHEYLVKVKLKNLEDILVRQTWTSISKSEALCEFDYKADKWNKSRKLYAIRILKRYEKKMFFGEIHSIPVYDYFCYCTNLRNKDAKFLHKLYGARAESENWIEHTKNQLHAGSTITSDFYVNDIFWTLSILAYNVSVMLRWDTDYKAWKEEPATFLQWFIRVPGKLITAAREVTLKMSKTYIFITECLLFDQKFQLQLKE